MYWGCTGGRDETETDKKQEKDIGRDRKNGKKQNYLKTQQLHSGYLSEEIGNPNQRRISTPVFVVAVFTAAGTWWRPKHTSVDEWIRMW